MINTKLPSPPTFDLNEHPTAALPFAPVQIVKKNTTKQIVSSPFQLALEPECGRRAVPCNSQAWKVMACTARHERNENHADK